MKASVLVIGEALLDVISADGETVVVPGGSPANVAVGLGRLGRRTRFLTWLARDHDGEVVEQHLLKSGIEILPSSFSAQKTSRVYTTIDEKGEPAYRTDIHWVVDNQTLDSTSTLDDCLLLYIGSVATMVPPGADAVAAIMRESRHRSLVFYDPNVRPAHMGEHSRAIERVENLVSMSDVVKVSTDDLLWLYPSSDPIEAIGRWSTTGPALVVLTAGAAGCTAISKTGQRYRLQATTQVEVVDTIGAGDAFMSSLIDACWDIGLAGLKCQQRLDKLSPTQIVQLLKRSMRAAEVTVGRKGANPPWQSELE